MPSKRIPGVYSLPNTMRRVQTTKTPRTGRPRKHTDLEAKAAIAANQRRYLTSANGKRKRTAFVNRPDQVARKNNWRLKSRFGISLARYNEMLVAQGGVCAICKRPEQARSTREGAHRPRPLSVDHCHRTNRVRGLLCFQCNVYLGYEERRTRETQWVTSAQAYLARSEALS